MCAIAGVWTRDGRRVPAEMLVALRDAMRRRGPDDAGLFVDGDLGLAHRRLSILDLSAAARQPLVSEDGRVRVVFNGEIYNHAALRRVLAARGHRFASAGDGEVLVHGYEEWGLPPLLERLNGMFAFAVWDGSRRRLVLARDRLGVKPLYVLRTGRLVAFASEVQALAAAFPELVAVDWAAIDAYLHFGFVPQDLGIYREIQALPPGHVLEVTEHDAVPRRYWRLGFGAGGGPPAAGWELLVRDTLERAVARRLVADVPVGLLLSGGVDSSVVAALARAAGADLQSFTVGFSRADAEDPRADLGAARAVARHLRLRHHERVLDSDALDGLDTLVRAFGVPFADASAIPTWHAGRLAREHGVKVVLTGDGGDEAFGGYSDAQAAYVGHLVRTAAGRVPAGAALLTRAARLDGWLPARPRMLHRLGTALRYAGADLAGKLRWTNGWHGAALAALRGPALREAVGSPDGDRLLVEHARRAVVTNDVERVLYADLAVILPGDYLVKADVSLMATSVEGRSPFLDVEVMELAAEIPLREKLSPWRTKHLLKRVAVGLGLPRAPIHRRKQGFGAPVSQWLRGPLRARARDAILGTLPPRGVVEPAVLRRVWEEHQSGRVDHGTRLWILLCLELWFRVFPPARVRVEPESAPPQAGGWT